MRERQIVAMGGGGFSMDDPKLDDYVLGLAAAARPAVWFVPTASGDDDSSMVRFHAAFPPERARASHLALFVRDGRDLLAVWRARGVDAILRGAWESGIVLAGMSAGSLCWFEGGVTDSFGPLAALADGLGFLVGSHCPHYDGEPARRPAYTRFVADGILPPGIAADDCCALRFAGTALAEVVASRPPARAYRVDASGETPIDARPLE
jgi:dipeptidase E